MRTPLLVLVASLAVIVACRSENERSMAFGRSCGDAADDVPAVGSLPDGQRLAWAAGDRVWALLPNCDEPFLVWQGEGDAIDTEWSDDGQLLAFGTGTVVHVLPVDQDAEAGAPDTFEGSAYSWLPDGRLFLARPGEPQGGVGWIADPVAGTAQDVVTSYVALFQPSPDGSLVAYGNYQDCPPGSIPGGAPVDYHCSTIWLSGIDGADQHQLVGIADMIEAARGAAPFEQGIIEVVDLQWSTTGEWLLFGMCGISASLCFQERYVYEIRPDGTGLRHVGDTAGAIDWAPDGLRYVMVREGGRIYDAYPRPLILRTAGGGGATVISPGDVEDREPQWSQDGTTIAFVSSPPVRTGFCRLCPPEVPEQGIWTMRADGSDRRQLTSSPEWLDTSPQWSSDGEWILFLRFGPEYVENEGFAHTELWLMRPDGGDQRMVADLSGVEQLTGGRGLSFDWWTP